jgi:anthranilate/para-aminobenzoate synthase component I
MNFVNAFAFFVQKIKAGEEGVFFSEREGDRERWIFGWGKKVEADFEKGPFPFFSLTSFDGKAHQFWHFDNFVSSNDDLNKSFEQMCKTSAQNVFNFSEALDTDTKESFCKKIETVRQLSEKGEVWVLNLAHSLSGELTDDKELLNVFHNFLKLEKDHCGGVIWTDEQKMCSTSPEVFLRQKENVLSTFPIKGTGTEAYLKNNEKEISELAMVTDLLRNDLGQIAQKVWVEKERVLVNRGDFFDAHAEIYATLPSIPPQEEGKSVLTWEQYRLLLPCGSICGAPKKRVVENILKLENFDREYYTGTFGVRYSPTDSVFNILIRTLFIEPSPQGRGSLKWKFPVGAGITYESIPDREWDETLQKAGVLLQITKNK